MRKLARWPSRPHVLATILAVTAPAPALGSPPCEVICSARSIDEPFACGGGIEGGCSVFPSPWVPANPGDVICGTSWTEGDFRDTDF